MGWSSQFVRKICGIFITSLYHQTALFQYTGLTEFDENFTEFYLHNMRTVYYTDLVFIERKLTEFVENFTTVILRL